MGYYVHWIDEELEVKPSLTGSPKLIEVGTPKEAWDTFRTLYPTLRDGEGDYYVVIRTGRVPRDDETDIVAEAGVDKKTRQPWFQEW